MKSKSKQQFRVLSALADGVSVTSYWAFSHAGITRLSAVIHELRKQGYEIKTIMEPNNQGGQHARYVLEVGQGYGGRGINESL